MTAKVCLLAVLLLVPATSRGGTLHGTFLITQVTDPLNGHPDTDAFNDLVGVPIVFDIHFDGIMSVHNQLGDFQEYPTEFITGPLSVSFGDNASALLRETVAPAIEGGPMDFTILNDAFHHSITLSSLNFGGAADDASFTFELGTTSTSDEVYVPLDEHLVFRSSCVGLAPITPVLPIVGAPE
jgi:hypothetical protein